jgi:O-antigen ligase
LLIWAEAGVGALVAFLLFVFVAFRRGWQGRRAPDPLLSAMGLGLAAAIAGHAVHMHFDIFLSRPLNQVLWLTAALLAAPAFVSARRSAERLPPHRLPAARREPGAAPAGMPA